MQDLLSIVSQPTPTRLRAARLALIEQWERENGDVPYEIKAVSGFNAKQGCDVAHVTCRAAMPRNMKWGPDGR